MKFIKRGSLAASLDAGGTCTDYDFLENFGFLSGLLRLFAGACLLACFVLGVLCRFVGQNRHRLVADAVFGNRYRLNTFNFKIEKFRDLYRFVGQNRYRLAADAVFGNRLPDCVFSTGKRPTSYSHFVGQKRIINAPDSVLSFLIQNRCFVGHVGQKQIK